MPRCTGSSWSGEGWRALRISEIALAAVAASTSVYVLPSGLPQPFLAALFAVPLAAAALTGRLAVPGGTAAGAAAPAAALLLWAASVDAAWFLRLGTADFLLSALQLLANLALLVLLAGFLVRAPRRAGAAFAVGLAAAKAAIPLAFAAGAGRYANPPRFNGFFNDPNQMAYWALCSFVMVFLLARQRRGLVALDLALTLAVVALSVSRSAALALALLAPAAALALVLRARGRARGRALAVAALAALALAVAGRGLIAAALAEFAGRFARIDIAANLAERGYTRAAEFPGYLALGAGNGAHTRFGTEIEIHSTFAGVLFYYGLPGALLLAATLAALVRRLAPLEALVLSGPLVYGLFTYGFRTPIFWTMLAVAIAASAAARPAAHPPRAAPPRLHTV